MTSKETKEVIDKIFIEVFNKTTNLKEEEIKNTFAFDIKLPKKVYDTTTNEETWADSTHNPNYITLKNMEKKDKETSWMLKKKKVSNIDEILNIFSTINLTTTERVYDSINVSKSDTIYNCENVYHSTGCNFSKNIVFCSSCINSNFLLASNRTTSSSYCIRTDDSKDCFASYNVICSNKIINSLFIQDCFDLYECMFCAHIASKKYCIANMQFEKEEYFNIKNAIIEWILECNNQES